MPLTASDLKRWLRRFVAPIDPPLMLVTALLLGYGLLVMASATIDTPARFSSQLVNIGLALVLIRVVAQFPPQTLMRIAPPAYIVGLALLIGVALFGDVSKGARRWLHVGVTRIQPSEIMKIAMPLMLAWYFHRREATLRLGDYALAALMLGVPVALIARQPDLGTALLVAAAGAYVIFFAGIGWRVILGLAVIVLASLPLAWSLLHDYQRNRILTLIDPEQDPLGKGFHIIQSTIAVGSGGLTGKGWMQGTQARLEFLPERHTDFIFAVLSEEFGFAGIAVLVTLYALLVARGLVIAANAPTFFSRLLAAALTLMLFTYAFVNMGMVSGILPVVGVPLPFVSYGGTAMVTLCLGIGMLMSISRNRMLVPN
jgi:rod shape determining protein RodA